MSRCRAGRTDLVGTNKPLLEFPRVVEKIRDCDLSAHAAILTDSCGMISARECEMAEAPTVES